MKSFVADAAGTRSRSRRQLALLPLLTLFHLALLLGLGSFGRQGRPVFPDSATRLEVRLLAPPLKETAMPAQTALLSAARRPALPPQQKPLPSTTQALIQPLMQPVLQPSSQPSSQPLSRPLLQPMPQPDSLQPSPPLSAAGSAPPKPGLLINTEATRRAIHQATRAPLLSERAATAMGDAPPLDEAEKLGREVHKAGNGDCLKGEFAGSGAGLLSLPFWLLAEARGKCAR